MIIHGSAGAASSFVRADLEAIDCSDLSSINGVPPGKLMRDSSLIITTRRISPKFSIFQAKRYAFA